MIRGRGEVGGGGVERRGGDDGRRSGTFFDAGRSAGGK